METDTRRGKKRTREEDEKRSPSSSEENSNHCRKTEIDVDSAVDTNAPKGDTFINAHPEDKRKYKQNTLAVYGMVSDSAALRKEICDRDTRIEELENWSGEQVKELERREKQIIFLADKVKQSEEQLLHYQSVLRTEMLLSAKRAQSEARRLLHQKQFELGHIGTMPVNGQEVWVEGNEVRNIIIELEEISARREEVEAQKKAAQNVLKQKRQEKDREDSSAAPMDSHEAVILAQVEVQIKNGELAALSNRAAALKQRREELEYEKKAFLKEIRRVTDEDSSEFLRVPTIGDEQRFILLHLLGKGGFSEVWKAFDCVAGVYVACKIHRVHREWSAQTRSQYLLHAERELQITRQLDHPSLTRLYEVFQLNDSMFVSVMEFCKGSDLDTYIKRYHTVKESDARLILEQIVSGLRYLANLENPIIHYDLKPANILLCSEDAGVFEIKITDFGLSKIVGATREGPSDNPSIELTSQGTGTYWYLPPECFETGATPRISNKVDVWSTGVIFYQMLFGRRPFAEGESQRKIWQEKLILSSARNLNFPDTPKVSDEAMNLIRRCLAPNVSERYDIFQLSQDPYLMSKRPGKRHQRAASTANMLAPTISTSDLPRGSSP
ncbi:tousled-like kinase [Angomonas deanei]|uniref:Protein tyrosine kinase/Protein kinase domain containing protein, putative n=1 Tax=Angomonas deanei TaxID=59799 RepID=S9WBH2_9TRYP|nr:tousled-like kinase [Angomonas deanei]EPY34908.1 tousled-like kinase [Angomonas deanei]EPY36451.1 tousled-like kinase [Angomonas deanei]EPY36517.1 tousled-like kinase [Angomonas deanei]CAD2213495.1 Protein tyrosine kinase/Protein kinase domain containing protein, putative [Angomonas deanei]|eukprot:EPY30051.1 tousled-like kinase [Angomonas deanei]